MHSSRIRTVRCSARLGGGGVSAWGMSCGPKVPRSVQICIFIFGGGGGVVVQTNIPEILEWGHSRNFEHKYCLTTFWKPLHHR